MKRLLLALALGLVFVTSVGMLGGGAGLRTTTVPDRSLSAAKIGYGALNDPRIYGGGSNPQAAGAFVLAFDDGWDRVANDKGDTISMYDSLSYWLLPANGGVHWTLGIIRRYVGTTNHLTATQLQALAANGVCLLNHGRWHQASETMTRDSLDLEYSSSYNWFADTLGVRVRGYDYYGGSSYNDKMIGKVAEKHDYGTGIFWSNPDIYEYNHGICYKSWEGPPNYEHYWWRYGGTLLGNFDTLSCYVGGHGGAWTDSIVRGYQVITRNAEWNPYILPISASVMAGGGTIRSFAEAKSIILLAERNRACGSIYFHKWDQAWMHTLMVYVKAEVKAGRLRSLTQDEAADEYVFTHPRDGANWFPGWGDSCSLMGKRNDGSFLTAAIPDGWSRDPLYGSTASILWRPKVDHTGYGGENFYFLRHASAGSALVYETWVPGDCWVLWSAKMSAYNMSTVAPDSTEVGVYLDAFTPRPTAIVNADGVDGSAHVTFYGSPPGMGGINGTNIKYDMNLADEWSVGNDTYANGCKMQSRWLPRLTSVWKEIRTWRYIPLPCQIRASVTIRTAPPASWTAGKGLSIQDVFFTVYHRSAVGMPATN